MLILIVQILRSEGDRGDGGRQEKFHKMTTSTYDVHNLCNLKCEGCSYFVTDRKLKERQPSGEEYDAFFASEVTRGATYPIFSGAEPSLNQEPLRIAARHWRYGAVFTNGIKAIDPDLPFRVVVSLWSGRTGARNLRGADTYDRALRQACKDRRAIVFFTINRNSVEDIPEVVEDCARFGLPLSFNFYSMTNEYARRLSANAANDDAFFRLSRSDSNIALTAQDRCRAAELIDRCQQKFPDTVLFDRSLGLFMAHPQPMHAVDPTTGLATNCAVLNATTHKSFNYDLTPDDRKDCCAPDLDCSDCRVLGAPIASLIVKSAVYDKGTSRNTADLLRLRELMMRLYYWDWDQPETTAQETPRIPAIAHS